MCRHITSRFYRQSDVLISQPLWYGAMKKPPPGFHQVGAFGETKQSASRCQGYSTNRRTVSLSMFVPAVVVLVQSSPHKPQCYQAKTQEQKGGGGLGNGDCVGVAQIDLIVRAQERLSPG